MVTSYFGQMTVTSLFGHVTVTSLFGHVIVTSLSGRVTVTSLGGHLTVTSLSGHVTVTPLLSHVIVTSLIGHVMVDCCTWTRHTPFMATNPPASWIRFFSFSWNKTRISNSDYRLLNYRLTVRTIGKMCWLVIIYVKCTSSTGQTLLNVVDNENGGGSRSRLLSEYGFGPWRSMSIYFLMWPLSSLQRISVSCL